MGLITKGFKGQHLEESMKGIIDHLSNQIKKTFGSSSLQDDLDPELDHLRRLRRLRRFMGNITAEEGRSVELEVEKLALQFEYSPQQVMKVLEWIIEGEKAILLSIRII